MASKEIISRRDLPHWYVPGAFHFVTYRLTGTLPNVKLNELRNHREALLKTKPPPGQSPAQYRAIIHKQLFAMYDSWLDESSSVRWLVEPKVAAMIRGNLYYHHGKMYHLLAYCIMPNHVHVLLRPIDTELPRGTGGSPDEESAQAGRLCHGAMLGEVADAKSALSKFMHSLKSYAAHEANKILGRNGVSWQSESYDHWVRDEAELERIVEYIAQNPVKANLVARPQNWLFCSTHDRFLKDNEPLGWLTWQ